VRKLIVNVLVLSFNGQFSELVLPPNTYIVGKRGMLEVTHLSELRKNLIIRFHVIGNKDALIRFLASRSADKIDVLLIYHSEDVLDSLRKVRESFPSVKTLIIGGNTNLNRISLGDVKVLDGEVSFQRIVENINQVIETIVKVPPVFNVAQIREEIAILKNFILKLDNDLRQRAISPREYFEEKKKLEDRVSALEKRLKSLVE
jgi:hypothetical protein